MNLKCTVWISKNHCLKSEFKLNHPDADGSCLMVEHWAHWPFKGGAAGMVKSGRFDPDQTGSWASVPSHYNYSSQVSCIEIALD